MGGWGKATRKYRGTCEQFQQTRDNWYEYTKDGLAKGPFCKNDGAMKDARGYNLWSYDEFIAHRKTAEGQQAFAVFCAAMAGAGLAVIENGEVRWARGYGELTAGEQVPALATTPFATAGS